MKYLHFIVNPISGSGTHRLTASRIRQQFRADGLRIEVDYTKHRGHAVSLVRAILSKKPDIVVACGGDGTINEVASVLIGTGIQLGIVPVGSGNGLASHLKIPKDPEQALALIATGKAFAIDVGKVNDRYFFSNMGIGLDAEIIRIYEQSRKRTLKTYILSTLKAAISYKSQKVWTVFGRQIGHVRPLLLFISNSNQMGYHMGLTPKASLTDGLLDVVIVPQIPIWKQLALGCSVLRNRMPGFQSARHIALDKIMLEVPENQTINAQIDGEFHLLGTNRLQVSILKGCLAVIAEKVI